MAGCSSGTISIQDRHSGKFFLMDSGADECVFPAEDSDFSRPRSTDLVATNGSCIKTFGKKKLSLSFAPGHEATHKFWIATVNRPILGADFFSSQEILIDVSRSCLITKSGLQFQATLTSRPRVFGIRVPSSCLLYTSPSPRD